MTTLQSLEPDREYAVSALNLPEMNTRTRVARFVTPPAADSVRVARDSNSGHRLLLPPADWCPVFAIWTARRTRSGW